MTQLVRVATGRVGAQVTHVPVGIGISAGQGWRRATV